MTPLELIALIESGLHLGVSSISIARQICAAPSLPSVEDLDAYHATTQEMRDTPNLAPRQDGK